jgi:Electron transfer DM13
MKLQVNLPIIASILCLAAVVGCGSPGTSSPPSTTIPSERLVSPPSGHFQSVEHSTQGNIRVTVDAKQRRFLVLQQNFKTDPGPDLYVILHRSPKPETYSPKSYVILGRLQKVNGMQQYEIPHSLNLPDYKSVVIWCRQFNATFGYAPL